MQLWLPPENPPFSGLYGAWRILQQIIILKKGKKKSATGFFFLPENPAYFYIIGLNPKPLPVYSALINTCISPSPLLAQAK